MTFKSFNLVANSLHEEPGRSYGQDSHGKSPASKPARKDDVSQQDRYLAWNEENAAYIAEYNAEVERDGMSFAEWRRV